MDKAPTPLTDAKQFSIPIAGGNHMVVFAGDMRDLERRLSALQADARWIPVEERMPDKEARLFYWIVPLTAEETYHDTSGNPILSDFKPHRHEGKWRTWTGLGKAIYWMPLPAAPDAALNARGGKS